MTDNHYPDVDTDAALRDQAVAVTAQYFGTLRGRIAVVVAHLGLAFAPLMGVYTLASDSRPCTAGRFVCAFSPPSMGPWPIVALGLASAVLVGGYWVVRLHD